MNRLRVATISLGLIAWAAIPSATWADEPAELYCHLAADDPSGHGGIPSNPFLCRVADDFVPVVDVRVQDITWSGGYSGFPAGHCQPAMPDDFVITVFADSPEGHPDINNIVAGPFFVGDNANRHMVGPPPVQFPFMTSQLKKYTYRVQLLPEETFQLQSGVTYWLEIYNNAIGMCYWVWQDASSPPGNGVSLSDSSGGDYSHPTPRPCDMSFCLLGPTGFEDCNNNSIPDDQEPDADGDGLIDDCDRCPSRIPADINGDHAVDLADVPEFVALLLDPNAGMRDADSACAADVNGDEEINGDDIEPFTALIIAAD